MSTFSRSQIFSFLSKNVAKGRIAMRIASADGGTGQGKPGEGKSRNKSRCYLAAAAASYLCQAEQQTDEEALADAAQNCDNRIATENKKAKECFCYIKTST